MRIAYYIHDTWVFVICAAEARSEIEKEMKTGGNLRFAEFVPLWNHVELDSIHSSRQECSSYQQNGEDHVRKRRREIHHLNITRSVITPVT